MGILKGLSRADARTRCHAWLERVGLPEVAKKRSEDLSKGMQQKIQFIAAVMHDPELLILDEPFSGLDPVNMRLLRDLIEAQHRAGTTILFSTHVMHQAEQMCDHIVMLHNGRKVLDDPLANIRARSEVRSIRFQPLNGDAPVPALLADVAGVVSVDRAESGFRIELAEGAPLEAIVNAITTKVTPARLELVQPNLEDVFIQIVTGNQAAGAQA
ncbi:MAG: AAA family ATPase [Ahniella sp.]|nr:AAA family ATPase [Ahniella sp.]